MPALNAACQDSDATLCNHLGCGKKEAPLCLRVVAGSLDLRRRGRVWGVGGVCSGDDLPPPLSE